MSRTRRVTRYTSQLRGYATECRECKRDAIMHRTNHEPTTNVARWRARVATTARLAGRQSLPLTSAVLSTNERACCDEVPEVNFRGEVDRLVHDYSRGDSFSPPSFLSFFLTPARVPTPSVSLAYTTHTRSVLSARLPQIFISGSTANSGRTGRSARDRPGFLTVLTASSPQAATAAAVVVTVVHRGTYARRVCARAALAVVERRRVCLNLNTLWQRRGEAVPSARVTPSELPRRLHLSSRRRRRRHA